MAPRCRPPGPCFRAAPHGGRGCQRGPGRSRGAHPPCSGPSAPPQGGAGTQAGCGLLAGHFRAPRPSLPLRVGGEVPGDAAGGEQAVRVVVACGGQRQQHVGRALGPRGDLRPRAQPGPCHRCHRAVLCQRAGGDRGQPAGPHFALTAGAAGPPPRPPETPSSSSLAVSGSGRRSRGAGPSAGWTSDWTSRPWRVVSPHWPWTAQDSASKPSLWPFPLTPPVLVPGQGHGGGRSGAGWGASRPGRPPGAHRSPGYDVSSGTAGRIAPSPCGSTSRVETGQPQRPPSAHTPRGCRITLLEEGTTYTVPSTAPGSGFPRNASRPRGLSRVFPDQRPPSTPLLTVLTTRLQNRHSRRASHDP